jgi:nucleotide-binding universal stress UspA family protein
MSTPEGISLARMRSWGLRNLRLLGQNENRQGGADRYKKILVPPDGSELADCALSPVNNLIEKDFLVEITLFNVVKVEIMLQTSGVIDINAIRVQLFSESRKYLADVESRLASDGIKGKTESLEGNRPGETISDYAQKSGMDLIVIAIHGYTGLKKLDVGQRCLKYPPRFSYTHTPH